MYTMVLMAALTATPDSAAFGGRLLGGGCQGSSCCGGAVVSGCGGCGGVSSCFGSGYSSGCGGGSCYSSGCGGCGGRGGLLGLGLVSRLRSGGGCSGSSCYSSGCGGSCYSSGYSSCHGSGYSSGCTGSGSCYGSSSCFGSGCGGGVSYGVPSYSAPTPYGGSGCGGFGGGAVYYGSDFQHGGGYAPPIMGSGIVGSAVPVVVPSVTIDNSKEFRAAEAKPNAAPARLTLELPASAKLFVDGTAVKGDGASRSFHTPDLAPGRTFYYDLKAEVVIDGKTLTQERRVLVKAGDALTESFGTLIAAAKGKDTAVAAK